MAAVGGKIVVLTDTIATRLTSTGAVDTTYGTAGQTPLEGQEGWMMRDGSILLEDHVVTGLLRRLDSDGHPDAAFGGSGTTLIERCTFRVSGPPGSGFVCIIGGTNRVSAKRFTAAGILDSAFGTAGTATILVPQSVALPTASHASPRSAVIQPDGSIVVLVDADIPTIGPPGFSTHSGIAALRLTPQGLADKSFGGGVGAGWTPLQMDDRPVLTFFAGASALAPNGTSLHVYNQRDSGPSAVRLDAKDSVVFGLIP
jgi:uncharacterized delta-60 repeat protein